MINGHKNIVFWFSGGKDSMACLILMQGYLKNIDVLWVNTGRNYPESLETVEKARRFCPRWHEIKTDRVGQWEKNGFPADVVPVDFTVIGQSLTHKKHITIQSYLQCCSENISIPLLKKTKELNATMVIRGQRKEENHRATTVNGDSYEGFKFWHPIEDWTKSKVMSYLKENMTKIPKHYKLNHSSMDCFDCTAYASESVDRAKYTKKNHPKLYADYYEKITAVNSAIQDAAAEYEPIIYLK